MDKNEFERMMLLNKGFSIFMKKNFRRMTGGKIQWWTTKHLYGSLGIKIEEKLIQLAKDEKAKNTS